MLMATVNDDPRWMRLVQRDALGEPFVYAVTTTGVYCRPGCASRLPRPKNVRFFTAPAEAEWAGFRACLRCRPDGQPEEAGLVARATAVIDGAETAPSLATLAAALEASPKTLVRAFKAAVGVTPKAFIQARRRERLKQALIEETLVTEAIYEAGYGASSRFYSEAQAVLGMTPARFRAKGAGTTLAWATASCPLGRVLVAATGKGVAMIAFGDDDRAREADMHARRAGPRCGRAHGRTPGHLYHSGANMTPAGLALGLKLLGRKMALHSIAPIKWQADRAWDIARIATKTAERLAIDATIDPAEIKNSDA